MRIALFGGSFNPPHIAHELASLFVLETQACDALYMVPAFRHPFEKALAPFEERFEMCQLAAARIDGCEVSRVEADLGGESRTLTTVKHLLATRPGDEISLVIGADLLRERHLWYGFRELESLVRFIVLGRRGYEGPEPMLPEVSSSSVRDRLRRGEEVAHLVSQPVLHYIREKGLYVDDSKP